MFAYFIPLIFPYEITEFCVGNRVSIFALGWGDWRNDLANKQQALIITLHKKGNENGAQTILTKKEKNLRQLEGSNSKKRKR